MKLVRVGLNESGFKVILLSLLGLKAMQSQVEIKGAATSSPTWVLIIKRPHVMGLSFWSSGSKAED